MVLPAPWPMHCAARAWRPATGRAAASIFLARATLPRTGSIG